MTDQNIPISITDQKLPIFPVLTEAKPESLVCMCSDPRFQKAFKEFIEGSPEKGMLGLKEGNYVPLTIPGAISSLTEPELYPKHFKIAKEQIEFFLNHFHSINQVILINHEDCAGYKALHEKISLPSFFRKAENMISRQKIDLKKTVKILQDLNIVKVNFKLYFAKFANSEHSEIIFEEIKI